MTQFDTVNRLSGHSRSESEGPSAKASAQTDC